MVAERPWQGHGYGNFEAAFAQHRDERFGDRVDMAHNTYIEHLVELGVPATLLLYFGPLLLFGYCVRGVFARRRGQLFPLVAVGATRAGGAARAGRFQPADPGGGGDLRGAARDRGGAGDAVAEAAAAARRQPAGLAQPRLRVPVVAQHVVEGPGAGLGQEADGLGFLVLLQAQDRFAAGLGIKAR